MPLHTLLILKVLILLLVANGTPVVAKRLLRQRLSWPIDGGLKVWDEQRLLGSSKTVRGLLTSIVATAAAAPFLELDWRTGALLGSAAMAGDLFSSFIKRRLHLPPSSRATGLDQIPESLFPFLACYSTLGLFITDVVTGVSIFFVGEIVLSRLMHRIGLRDRPY